MTRRNKLTRQIYNKKEKHKRSSLTIAVNDKQQKTFESVAEYESKKLRSERAICIK